MECGGVTTEDDIRVVSTQGFFFQNIEKKNRYFHFGAVIKSNWRIATISPTLGVAATYLFIGPVNRLISWILL